MSRKRSLSLGLRFAPRAGVRFLRRPRMVSPGDRRDVPRCKPVRFDRNLWQGESCLFHRLGFLCHVGGPIPSSPPSFARWVWRVPPSSKRTPGASIVVSRVRLSVDNERLKSEVAMLREELRIKDTRLGAIQAARRPHYPPTERLAILALKAARGWNNVQTARAFLITDATIASWLKRLAEAGHEALVQLPRPVNRFPEFVTLLVQQLKSVCPVLGKARVAQMLARAGLHLAPSTVRRMLDKSAEPLPGHPPHPQATGGPGEAHFPNGHKSDRTVTAKYPHHVWHVDLTAVPTHCGFWVPWFPFASIQCWPFCFWVVVVLDHYSRKALMHGVFKTPPSAHQVTDWLDVAIQMAGRVPRTIVSDQGPQFR